jgi:oxygen-independent coproporphyrinogen III oxidase
MSSSLSERMKLGGYDGYSYAYPHKTAYRRLDPPIPLRDAWRFEDKQNLFLYVHLPFCEMRCGFCNLFTTVQPGPDFVSATLTAIERQSAVVANSIAPERIAQAAFGGGTPSFLSVAQLDRMFTHLNDVWPFSPSAPISFEMSPGTVTEEKLTLLKAFGVDRISLGVQSIEADDLISLKRPQRLAEVHSACDRIKAAGFGVFNIDLIYGNEGQDAARWEKSLNAALAHEPEELYLYPLYIRKLTNLARTGKKPAEHRRDLYRQARDLLLASGYRQISMRLFRRHGVTRDTDYCCQDDGMIGLGPGARSYTRELHYSSEYAVAQTGVRGIIERFNARSAVDFAHADYGIELGQDEQKLRYVIKSLLRVDGISYDAYHARFGSLPCEDSPQLDQLFDLGLAFESDAQLRLNDEGMEWSDTIGPWLYSESITRQMAAYDLA